MTAGQRKISQRPLVMIPDVQGELERTRGEKWRGSRDELWTLTSKVPTEHKIQNKETILVVLKGISQVDNKGMVNL